MDTKVVKHRIKLENKYKFNKIKWIKYLRDIKNQFEKSGLILINHKYYLNN